MAQYVDKSLAPGERILIRGRWPIVMWLAAWAALLVLGVALVGVLIFVMAAIHMSTTEIAVTDQRIILKRGWLNRRTEELAVGSVEGVNLEQSILGRLFGYGSIHVSGTGDAHIVFPPMARPVAFRRAIEEARKMGQEVHVVADTPPAKPRSRERA